ncbi:MAG: hypothetical protein Q4D76_00535 [Oscillospiraceae bacterium]|nr:hypothetical protein [Oscillospiraceae bacterium]
MLRFNKFLKNQRGSVQVIEAAFVYPVVILAAAALIYLGIYVFEISYLDARAKATAVMAAKTISFTGYDELGDIYTGFGLNPDDDKPDREQVRKAYEKNSPYRYLRTGEADERFSEMTGGYASGLMFASADTECSIDVSRKMFGREVEVKIRKRISLPSVLGLAGADCFRTIEVSATAETSDPAEFIRNTDLVMGTAKEIAEATGADEKISDIKEKITGVLKKLKAGNR